MRDKWANVPSMSKKAMARGMPSSIISSWMSFLRPSAPARSDWTVTHLFSLLLLSRSGVCINFAGLFRRFERYFRIRIKGVRIHFEMHRGFFVGHEISQEFQKFFSVKFLSLFVKVLDGVTFRRVFKVPPDLAVRKNPQMVLAVEVD